MKQLRCGSTLAALLLLATSGALVSQDIPSFSLTGGVVYFDAEATMGDFTGWSTAVTGQINGGDSIPAVTGWIQVQVSRINTNHKKRDEHLEEHMEVEKFPHIRFELVRGRRTGQSGDSVLVDLTGTMEIYGQSRLITIPARVYWDQNGVHVWIRGHPLDMRDYGLEAPTRFVIARMDPVVNLRGEFIFGDPATAPDLQ